MAPKMVGITNQMAVSRGIYIHIYICMYINCIYIYTYYYMLDVLPKIASFLCEYMGIYGVYTTITTIELQFNRE